jgi:hypothetical protein
MLRANLRWRLCGRIRRCIESSPDAGARCAGNRFNGSPPVKHQNAKTKPEFPMMPHASANHRWNHGLRIGLKVSAWSLDLIVCSYGLVKTPEPWLILSNETSANVPTAQVPPPVVPMEVTAPSLAQDARALTFDERDDRSEAPRECFPEKGISNACIYH